ncbi:MAG: methylated-DNA--[protein]-cysteine S-methyltransferase [Magnetococcales bacterium]|nr:methylated-DNA--[protein]-cysteine S-methyltransferase [Magnetococcales bacterium]
MASPLGPIRVATRRGAVVALAWGDLPLSPPATEGSEPGVVAQVARWLGFYFSGREPPPLPPLDPPGTPFQCRVWETLRGIPPGETRTYGELARRLGSSPRAVGAAAGANPIPLLIPCHRLVAKGGLGGFSGHGGIATKRRLLDFEAGRWGAGATLSPVDAPPFPP